MCSVGLVADLMHEQRLAAVQSHAYPFTMVREAAGSYPDDVIGQDLTATAPGTRLVGDIAYLRAGEDRSCLAVVIDLPARIVVGWQIAENMSASLAIDAFSMARDHGYVTRGASFHTDRGTPCQLDSFAAACPTKHVNKILGRAGVCLDNAAA
jgi:putative transposase